MSAASQPFVNPPRTFTTTIVDEDGNPHEYVTTRLPSSKARHVLASLGVIVGGALDTSLGFSSAIQGVSLAMMQEDFEKVDLQLLSLTSRDGRNLSTRVEVERVSQDGGFDEYAQAVMWVLKVNFERSFNAGLERIVGAIGSETTKAGSILASYVTSLRPTPTSTGSSGESSTPDSGASEK